MRITQRSASNTIKANLARGAEQLELAWRHVASGKRVERPSDDPAAVARILSYRSLQSEVAQRRFQAEQGLSVLTTVSSAFDEAGKVMAKAQELALASGSGGASEEDRKVMGKQVEEMLAQLQDIMDMKYDDRELFGSPGTFYSSTDMSNLQLDKNAIFGPAVSVLQQLQVELSSGNRASDASIAAVTSASDNIMMYNTQVGARVNRLEGLQERLLVMEEDLTTRRSADEEVDIAKAIVDLNEEQTAYQSALSATARIMQVSLVDFL